MAYVLCDPLPLSYFVDGLSPPAADPLDSRWICCQVMRCLARLCRNEKPPPQRETLKEATPAVTARVERPECTERGMRKGEVVERAVEVRRELWPEGCSCFQVGLVSSLMTHDINQRYLSDSVVH